MTELAKIKYGNRNATDMFLYWCSRNGETDVSVEIFMILARFCTGAPGMVKQMLGTVVFLAHLCSGAAGIVRLMLETVVILACFFCAPGLRRQMLETSDYFCALFVSAEQAY